MISKPQIVQRAEQPYAAIRVQVPIPFGSYLRPLWAEVSTWLAGQSSTQHGPPHIRYLTTDMSRKLDIEVGFHTPTLLTGNQRVFTGVFPAGAYAVAIYTGTVRGKGLMRATGEFLDWAKENAIPWQTRLVDGAEWWDARIENYLTDPDIEPDLKKWQTELAFKVAES